MYCQINCVYCSLFYKENLFAHCIKLFGFQAARMPVNVGLSVGLAVYVQNGPLQGNMTTGTVAQ